MENVAVFLQHMPGKLVRTPPQHAAPLMWIFSGSRLIAHPLRGLQFVYEWNTEKEKMLNEFSSKARWPNAEVFKFGEEEVYQQLLRDEQAGRHVVVVLTASTNYPFARSQLRFFSAHHSIFIYLSLFQ